MELTKYVADRIRELRTSYGQGTGVSQEVLAKALDVATNTISRWETGTYEPSLNDLEKLARFFGVSIMEFFPKQSEVADQRVDALLRAAKQLDDADLEELRRYAEFRRAQSLYPRRTRPRPGRKPKGAP